MAPQRQSGDVDRNVTEPVAVQPMSAFQRMLRAMEQDATAASEDQSFTGDDLTAILEAETVEEMFEAADRGSLNIQHLAGCDLELIDVEVKYSRGGQSDIVTPFITSPDKDGNRKKMYLLITAVRISDAQDKPNIKLPKMGEIFQFNTSARQVTAEIWWLYTRGKIDADTHTRMQVHVKEVDLGGGQAVSKLRPVTKRATEPAF
ncbi:MAG TPA: hypothetical protein VNB49_10580 [Candidatus Dormibacteraeota bacterium]|nr:hypothetical protein [Candidatus Dormibacteraeota bacterium]